ncbi:MAG: hypothetical protein AAGI53_11465 [Planctomycetota bacterium]
MPFSTATRLAGLLTLAAFTAGCNIAAPLYFAVAGPGDVDREFELDDDRSIVVFVDDPSNKVATRRLRLVIGESAQDNVIKKNLVEDGMVVDARSALAATTREREGEPLSIAEIGRTVGADSVIYVLVTEFDTSSISSESQPFAKYRIKVIDSETSERLWPIEDEAGFAMRVVLPTDASAVGAASRTEALKVQRDLAQRSGIAIAQLFYDVEVTLSVRRN